MRHTFEMAWTDETGKSRFTLGNDARLRRE
jgi:hypothetical protein